jgi:hypothetical protein
MENFTSRSPTKSEKTKMALRRRQRSFFARWTQPIHRARVSKLMLAKMGRQEESPSPPDRPVD